MTLLEAVFWLSAACVFYTYIGYPLILAVAARLWPCGTTNRGKPPVVPVSVVVVAFNEEACIGRRVRELAWLLASRPAGGEVIVVSDGSTDRTAEVAQAGHGSFTPRACCRE